MGLFWQFFSFERERWDAAFNGKIPDARKHFAASAVWDHVNDDLPDPESEAKQYLDALWKFAPPKVVDLAERIAHHGISYEGLSRDSAALLDSMVVGFFCPEGLASLLDYTVEHKQGVSPKAIGELLSRSQSARVGGFLGMGGKVCGGMPITLAQCLGTGRRFGTHEVPNEKDKYFVLDDEEVRLLLSEVSGLLAVEREWKTPEFERVVRDELLPALERAAAGGRYLAGRYT